jgi:CPA1 family monovalent cation:H+ antiporter
MKYLEEKYDGNQFKNDHVHNLYTKLKLDLNFFDHDTEELLNAEKNTRKDYQVTYLELLDQQRKLLKEMNHKAEFDEELIRKYLSLIDLEEFKLREN